jgi:hypothetical protein
MKEIDEVKAEMHFGSADVLIGSRYCQYSISAWVTAPVEYYDEEMVAPL